MATNKSYFTTLTLSSDSYLGFDPNLDIEAIEQEQEVSQEFSHLCDTEY